mgnify:CR=1|jgi:hypothetical protein
MAAMETISNKYGLIIVIVIVLIGVIICAFRFMPRTTIIPHRNNISQNYITDDELS